MDSLKRMRALMASGMDSQALGMLTRAAALRQLARLDDSTSQIDCARHIGTATRFEEEARALVAEAHRLREEGSNANAG